MPIFLKRGFCMSWQQYVFRLPCILHIAKQCHPDACDPELRKLSAIPNVASTLCISRCLKKANKDTG